MPRDRPNILFFFTDDQRFDTIRALGNDRIVTPNMDRLVARGTAFTHAHIPCGTSGAVCMPSRAMLHSGRSLFHLAGAGESIPREHTTLGEALRAAGYRTFGTGKWHNGRESFHRSFAAGDEIVFGGMADHWNVPAYHFDPTGRYDTRCLVTPEPFKSNRTVARDCDHIHAGRHSTELIADSALAFLDAPPSDAPFFLYVSFLAPHDPRTMPQRYRDLYPPESIELPASFMGGHPFDNGDLHVRDEELAAFPRDPGEIRRHIAEYYAMITHLDDQLGRLTSALEARGLLDSTIVVLAGDNGLALGRHGLMGKQNCYDHSVRVPLVFAGPGVPQGRRTDAFAYLFDIFPTLCDLTGTPTPPTVDGTSLVPAMRRPEEKVRDSLFFAYTGMHRAVRDRQWKLIEYVVKGRHNMTQLFDLQADPDELNNLAAHPALQPRVNALREQLRSHARAWGDMESTWGQTFWNVFEPGDGSRRSQIITSPQACPSPQRQYPL